MLWFQIHPHTLEHRLLMCVQSLVVLFLGHSSFRRPQLKTGTELPGPRRFGGAASEFENRSHDEG